MAMDRPLLDDEITTYLENFFNKNKGEMSIVWKKYQAADPTKNQDVTKGKELAVFRSLQDQLVYTPSLEIVYKDKKTEIFSIGTQHDTYTYDILISVEAAHPIHSDTYLKVVGNVAMDLLNSFSNRSFQVPKFSFCSYYSEASSLEMGFRRGKGLRSSRISWMCKILKPNRY